MIKLRSIDLDHEEELAGVVLRVDLADHVRLAELLSRAPAAYFHATDGVLITLTVQDLKVLDETFRAHGFRAEDEDIATRVLVVLSKFGKD